MKGNPTYGIEPHQTYPFGPSKSLTTSDRSAMSISPLKQDAVEVTDVGAIEDVSSSAAASPVFWLGDFPGTSHGPTGRQFSSRIFREFHVSPLIPSDRRRGHTYLA